MVFKSEDLQPVTNLTNELTSELKTSYRKVERITELLKKLGHLSSIDFNNSSKDLIEANEPHETVFSNDSKLEKVKNENLQLLMDIQREEFLNRKWNRVLDQNSDIFNSLCDWIKLNLTNNSIDDLEFDVMKHLKVLKRSKRQLNQDIRYSEQRIDAMSRILDDLKGLLDDIIEEDQQNQQINFQ